MSARFVIGCAGLHADRIALLAGERPGVRIVPFRGEYYKLRPERRGLVRNLIYPVPDPALPFLGVHFMRTVHGDIEAGPNAMLALAREGYRRAAWSPRDAAEALAFPGLWRFLARYPSVSVAEVGRTFSRAMFAEALARLVPDVRPDDLVPGGAGVRAQAMTPSGALVHDFVFLESPGALHVLNAPSPAATACLVIGEEIAARALRAQAA
jgi:L-2-hydroxyglutarate oxidase LhgO